MLLVACVQVATNLCKLLPGRRPPPQATPAEAAGMAEADRQAAVGARAALRACTEGFGGALFTSLTSLWTALSGGVSAAPCAMPLDQTALRTSLGLVGCLAPHLSGAAAASLGTVVPALIRVALAAELPGATPGASDADADGACGDGGVQHDAVPQHDAPPLADVRSLAAGAVATCCDALGSPAVEALLGALVPASRPTAAPATQLGAALCLRAVLAALDTRVLPYAALLIAPLVAALASDVQVITVDCCWMPLMAVACG